ncbi:MAG: hypothetical protein D6685_00695 [Bacteroidetes bacterium]|nr:MAG: hypothetical protein D6685_00695 [Bacteroidota bacterium]
MASLREIARHYDTGQLQPMLDEWADEPVTPLDQLIEATSEAAGRLEDLDGEIPPTIWQGFGDA